MFNYIFRINPANLTRWALEKWTVLLLTALYTVYYLDDSARPGNNSRPCCIKGWIGWWDQGQYYASVWALAAGDLDPNRHWYPLGYPLLAMPFKFLGSHPFFPIDLASLLICYAAFLAFARRTGVSTIAAVTVFLLTVCADPLLFKQWAIPWTTSPGAATTWALLATAAAYLGGRRRPFLLGFLAASLPLFRPTDAIISVICLGWVALAELRISRLRALHVGAVVLGGLTPLIPYAALYLAIYGPVATPYMVHSKDIGFTLHNLVWRAFVLLLEPRQWFFAGEGLLARIPWLILGFAGALVAWRRMGPTALLAACLIAYCLVMLAYVDLLPTGLWRYYNIHYFKWTLPGFGLLAWMLLRDLLARSRLAWAALAMVLLLSAIRVTPRPAAADEPALAIDIPGPAATEDNTTMAAELAAVDSYGPVQNITQMRAFAFPAGDGIRLIGLKRDFVGEVGWKAGHGPPMPVDPAPERRWAEHFSLGYPCWLPPHVCKRR
jgi:hypothetical protein